MAVYKVIIISLALTLVIASPHVCAQNPISNPSFEIGATYPDGWTTYEYTVNGYDDGLPVVGCAGSECIFTILPPSVIPNGSKVCGLQSIGDGGTPAETGKNGGVYQTFTWNGGKADITISTRAYSEKSQLDEYYNVYWVPYDNGCRIRAGIANGAVNQRSSVSPWVESQWGNIWDQIKLTLYFSGTYTIFIESYQPNPQASMSTLWDNISWWSYILITQAPTVQIGPDANHPDTTALITWTTDTPCTSRLDYGTTTAYGQHIDNSTPKKQHSVLLENLTPATHYNYRVTCSAPLATDVSSDNCTFDLPIKVSDVSAVDNGSNVVITWTTDIATKSQVKYGKTTGYENTTELDSTLTTSHTVTIPDSSLEEDTEYHYVVLSAKTAYTTAASADSTFRTLPGIKTSIQNPSFENGLFPWAQYQTPMSGSLPIDGRLGPYPSGGGSSWSDAAIQAYDGSYFAGAASSEVYKNGGLFQRIYWPAGTLCSLCARFATKSIGGGLYDTRFRIGIDPNGGIDPTASGIVWWKSFSPTNDNKWYPSGVMATAGSGGVVTVFLDVYQQYPIMSHIVAFDDVTFGEPIVTNIGALKQEKKCTGAEIQNAVVTLIAPSIAYEGVTYTRAYVQPEDSQAGIAVLFKNGSGTPPGYKDKVTVKGTLTVINKEAVIIAYDWATTAGPFDLPLPYAMSGRSIGGQAHNQPALYGSNSICNVGLRIRVWGRVTAAMSDYGSHSTTCLLDDGASIQETPTNPSKGIRVKLVGTDPEVYEDDYIVATGVLTTQHVDPDSTPSSGDEYELYIIINTSSDEWTYIPAGQ